ncbi:MAG: twin arginine-targeting protein translocase TatB [Candidatus Tectomicrobia bacterium RIFCSPLOWO2_02_FULL_70_19]|nr:MAG: twin arginine-targeting protein translocase TatB [Candidatus Tectomicrobia bacterium RIFCSPLOWO2_02_FULL_70_19]
MFGSIGFPELVVIFVVALLVIGPQRLPEVARSLGRTLRELKRVTSDLQNSFDLEDEFETEIKAGPSTEENIADKPKAETTGAEAPRRPSEEPTEQLQDTGETTEENSSDAPTETEVPRDGGSRPT